MIVNRRAWKLVIFSWYSFFENLFFLFFDPLPHFLRILGYKLLFNKYGHLTFIDHHTYFRYFWKIKIGNRVTINRGSQFFASMHRKGPDIIIGDDVTIGPNVKILAASHDYTSTKLADISRPVEIKRHCWIGANAILLPGVTLEKGVVVGAGSVVTKSVSTRIVVAGNPARIIKNRYLQTDVLISETML